MKAIIKERDKNLEKQGPKYLGKKIKENFFKDNKKRNKKHENLKK